MENATFAAGCFWGVEAVFRQVPGVESTSVGYIGGETELPTYQDVCTGTTGHAEAVELKFDPEIVSFEKLLHVFWENHDPTTLNRQGPDIGTQYRSAVFCHSVEQAAAAAKVVEELDTKGRFVTEIVPAVQYWLAEEYHQQYFEKQSGGRSRFF